MPWVGTCESFYETDHNNIERCAQIVHAGLGKIVNKIPKCFLKKGDLGHTDLVQHKINTGSAVPIRQSLRRLPFGKRQTEKEEILRMLDLGGD
jgi:hypothetical protein